MYIEKLDAQPPAGLIFFISGEIGQITGWRLSFLGWRPLWVILDPILNVPSQGVESDVTLKCSGYKDYWCNWRFIRTAWNRDRDQYGKWDWHNMKQ